MCFCFFKLFVPCSFLFQSFHPHFVPFFVFLIVKGSANGSKERVGMGYEGRGWVKRGNMVIGQSRKTDRNYNCTEHVLCVPSFLGTMASFLKIHHSLRTTPSPKKCLKKPYWKNYTFKKSLTANWEGFLNMWIMLIHWNIS